MKRNKCQLDGVGNLKYAQDMAFVQNSFEIGQSLTTCISLSSDAGNYELGDISMSIVIFQVCIFKW